MNNLEIDPFIILKNLKKSLNEVNEKIDKSLKTENLSENANEIDTAIDYLNSTIRQLDHAAENLLATRNQFSE